MTNLVALAPVLGAILRPGLHLMRLHHETQANNLLFIHNATLNQTQIKVLMLSHLSPCRGILSFSSPMSSSYSHSSSSSSDRRLRSSSSSRGIFSCSCVRRSRGGLPTLPGLPGDEKPRGYLNFNPAFVHLFYIYSAGSPNHF